MKNKNSLRTQNERPDSQLGRFIYEHFYDIENILRRHRTVVAGELEYATTEQERRKVKAGVAKIDGWLRAPNKQEVCEFKLQVIRSTLNDKSLSAETAVKKIQNLARTPAAPVGRPRTGYGRYAIRAVTLMRSTGKTLAEVTFELTGCVHSHPRGASCKVCTGRMRAAVSRLREFLRRNNLADCVDPIDLCPNLPHPLLRLSQDGRRTKSL